MSKIYQTIEAQLADGVPPKYEGNSDAVNHPPHYVKHPSGVECIEIVEHMSFNLGNAVKYLWRCDEKGNSIEDLKKAEWYIRREIERRLK